MNFHFSSEWYGISDEKKKKQKNDNKDASKTSDSNAVDELNADMESVKICDETEVNEEEPCDGEAGKKRKHEENDTQNGEVLSYDCLLCYG